jgi:hypothetical protein
MPQKVFPSNKKPFSLALNVSTLIPMKLKVQAFDKRRPYAVYYRMAGNVDRNGRTFNLSFPVSPDELLIRVFPEQYKTYDEYQRYSNDAQRIVVNEAKVGPLKTTPIWLSNDDRDFIKFAEWFSTNASVLSATQVNQIPSIYKSDSGKFVIHYHTKIRNKDGSYVTTPARIGHTSGEIDVSQVDFMKYSIPGRMAILLHEYSHKYVNESTGLKVSDEIGADINALNIYLSLGYSPIEAGLVFLNVFETANNEYNHKRYLALKDFMTKFTNGQLAQYYTLVKGKNDTKQG